MQREIDPLGGEQRQRRRSRPGPDGAVDDGVMGGVEAGQGKALGHLDALFGVHLGGGALHREGQGDGIAAFAT